LRKPKPVWPCTSPIARLNSCEGFIGKNKERGKKAKEKSTEAILEKQQLQYNLSSLFLFNLSFFYLILNYILDN